MPVKQLIMLVLAAKISIKSHVWLIVDICILERWFRRMKLPMQNCSFMACIVMLLCLCWIKFVTCEQNVRVPFCHIRTFWSECSFLPSLRFWKFSRKFHWKVLWSVSWITRRTNSSRNPCKLPNLKGWEKVKCHLSTASSNICR